MPGDDSSRSSASGPHEFATTQWSIVLKAGEGEDSRARQALNQLCETYWFPLYVYLRRRVPNVDDAQDITQAFFVHLLEKDVVARADRSRGRFRAFLLTAAKNFLANERQKQQAQKRGGYWLKLSLDFAAGESKYQLEPAHELTAEKLFERKWVTTLLDRVLATLCDELAANGKQEFFVQLKPALVGNNEAIDYQLTATALGISPAAAKQAAYRLRKRYRQLLREEVARTVADEADVDEEISRLLGILAD